MQNYSLKDQKAAEKEDKQERALGFGTGKGESKSGTGPAGGGEGAGGAAGVSPIAIVVLHKSTPGPGGVEVKSLAPPSGIGKAIGDIATAVMQGMNERSKKHEEGAIETPM